MSRSIEAGQMIGIVVKPNGGVVVNEYTPSKGELRRQVRQEADRNAFEARVADLKSLVEQGALGYSRTVRGPFRNKR